MIESHDQSPAFRASQHTIQADLLAAIAHNSLIFSLHLRRTQTIRLVSDCQPICANVFVWVVLYAFLGTPQPPLRPLLHAAPLLILGQSREPVRRRPMSAPGPPK